MNNWALDVQNIHMKSDADVDWAELAKKWIQIRENTPDIAQELPAAFLQPPPPPPLPEPSYPVEQSLQPPGIGVENNKSIVETAPSNVENTGSVDMEIEEDKDPYSQSYQNNGEGWKSWPYPTEGYDANQMHQNWGYNYAAMGHNRVGHAGSNIPHESSSNDVSQNATLNSEVPNAGFSNFQMYYAQNENQYWNSQNMSTSSGVMMQKVVDYGHKDRRIQANEQYQDQRNTEISAQQRKQLPRWIREGLEKMERDKFKISEKERLKTTQEAERRKKKEEDDKARRLLQEFDDGTPKPPIKSKFDSDSDNSDVEEEDKRSLSRLSPAKEVSDVSGDGHGLDRHLTEEEKAAQMTAIMKDAIVAILKEVTDGLILSACREVIGKSRMKVQQSKKSPGLGLLSGGIGGLGIYNDSGGDSEPGDEDPIEEASIDSDEELKQTIRRKRRDFEPIEKEIMRKVEAVQSERPNDDHSHSDREPSSPDSSSQEKLSEPLEDSDKAKDSHSGDPELPENSSKEAQSSIGSSSNREHSESKSSSSTSKKKKKKKKKKRSRKDSSDSNSEVRKRKKKRKKFNNRSHSRSRSPKKRGRSRSRSMTRRTSRSRYNRRRNSRSRSTTRRRRSRSRSTVRRRSRSRSTVRRRSRSRSTLKRRSRSRSIQRRRSRSRTPLRRKSRSRSPMRKRRSRSTTYSRRTKRSKSRSTYDNHRRSQRSPSRHRTRRSRSRHRYGKRHRRSRSRSGSSRNRRSRSVEIKERSKRRSRS